MEYKGKAHVVGENIDTDAIIPARFLVTTDEAELGRHCMSGLEENWVSRVSKGDIMVAGENFGCGSSREHAPVAIKGAGIPVVIAHSFARIFYRNAFNTGLILLEVGDEYQKISDGEMLTVDTEKGTITTAEGVVISCSPVPSFMQEILDAGGLVGYVRKQIGAE
ncbi:MULTISPECIES: 3-isopropylmalate dehydratase small subunit [Methanorbis]|uniref:3-isopropylmalate dehydratase small subunit n=2 Tax=Methanorbis TaxID=3136059 RepID=A0AAE4SBA2_9EURY|nr:3-isopropylmalate dehydratase small subunit [Methanocorpusculaceae archaeon Sp1]MDV0441326.1 3-isopropylmalate dehydratase small subunit [Methanocorpusculaceae archaeon Ag1]MDV0443582.1 3-isopropylmalate dehydratase small subunit [Methanocorpusculaceae archaeon Cs1]